MHITNGNDVGDAHFFFFIQDFFHLTCSNSFYILQFSWYTVSMNNNETKKGISEEEIASTIKELCHLIKKSDDEAFIYEFFNCLFTKPELKDIANRWLLVKEIDAGTTQREIANKFSMSLCKITRGSRELNKEDSAFRKMLELLKNQ